MKKSFIIILFTILLSQTSFTHAQSTCGKWGFKYWNNIDADEFSWFKNKAGGVTVKGESLYSGTVGVMIALYDKEGDEIFRFDRKSKTLLDKYVDYTWAFDVPGSILEKSRTASFSQSKYECISFLSEKETKRRKKRKTIYNNCIIDKMPENPDWEIRKAVQDSCDEIADDPSVYQSWKYQ